MDQPKTPNLNLVGLVYNTVCDGEWWTPFEIMRTLQMNHNEWHSDSTVTARLRDLRKPQYGGYVIEKRLRIGSKAYEYRIAGRFQ
jgi:hypothetical protein